MEPRAPFGAEVADGCVWGRGAIDMKAKGAMDLGLMPALARAGVAPNRDLVLAAVADEEAGRNSARASWSSVIRS